MKPLPDGLANEWIRFVETKPSIQEQADWCQLKADEDGWDFFDLSLAPARDVRMAHLPEPDDGSSGPVN